MNMNLKRGSSIFKLCLLTFTGSPSSSAFSSSSPTKLFAIRRNLSLLFMQKEDYPLGGDYAGLSATFNPKDGSFIPIPEYLGKYAKNWKISKYLKKKRIVCSHGKDFLSSLSLYVNNSSRIVVRVGTRTEMFGSFG